MPHHNLSLLLKHLFSQHSPPIFKRQSIHLKQTRLLDYRTVGSLGRQTLLHCTLVQFVCTCCGFLYVSGVGEWVVRWGFDQLELFLYLVELMGQQFEGLLYRGAILGDSWFSSRAYYSFQFAYFCFQQAYAPVNLFHFYLNLLLNPPQNLKHLTLYKLLQLRCWKSLNLIPRNRRDWNLLIEWHLNLIFI